MKKIDKLILQSFLNAFALTFLVVTFILLNRQLLVYYDDIIGKGLEWSVIRNFIGYLTVFILPQALPLSILLASLISFGNLGEHFELTAIKSAGISLTRIILPVSIFVLGLSVFALYFNNQVVPTAALNAFSLMYDIKQTKPTLDIREGIFYNGLPDISIKVNRKFAQDPAALKDILLYDHQNENKEVYVADSGRMFTILNDRYLKFELYQGYQYKEEWQKSKVPSDDLSQTKFSKIEMIVDLSSFDMSKTDTRSFSSHRYMKNMKQLDTAVDSLEQVSFDERLKSRSLLHHSHEMRLGTTESLASTDATLAQTDVITTATNQARQIKSLLESQNELQRELNSQINSYRVQWHRILSYSFACLAMLLIGAPLGAIVKKGGLGLPFLIAIIFFVIFFVFDMQGEKLSNRNIMSPAISMWLGNGFLLTLGFYFLYQARIDGRLFDQDHYIILFGRLGKRFRKF